MKIIFLDIDGVLNTYRTRDHHTRVSHRRFDPDAVDHLNDLIRQTGANIVISSSWRQLRSLDQLRSIFNEEGVEGEIIDETPILPPGTDRAMEVRKWLREIAPEKQLVPDEFVIIDDFTWAFPEHFGERFVHTDPEVGLSDRDAYRNALNILQTDPDP